MGLRFRKSVKICKGVKVNFSKSGASLSLGGRGHAMNFGRRGVKATLGIPGTGLSYGTTIIGGHKKSGSHHKSKTKTTRSTSRSTSSSRQTYTTPLPKNIQIKMDPNGKVEVLNEWGGAITDQSVLRKIKQTDAYKNQVQILEQQRQQMLDNAFNDAKEENDKFIDIYKLSPDVDKLEKYQEILANLKPSVYVCNDYTVPCPTEEQIRTALMNEAKENVSGNFFTVGKLRKSYVEDNLQTRLTQEMARWKSEKEAFDSSEKDRERSENERFLQEFENNKTYMQDIIAGENEVVSEMVEAWIASCELPVEINVDYEWDKEKRSMYLDVDLPEIEDIPENEVVRLASGNLKEKKKTQATLKEEYMRLVFGLAIFISANIYNCSPAIHNLIISGYTQRRDKSGELNDEYVYSIKFTRDIFENSFVSRVDPYKFCMRFENRCNVTSTMLMKKIEPFEAE